MVVWAIDYNLRQADKKKLAEQEAMRRWRWFMRPRSRIERFFAWTKLYYRLSYFKVQGWLIGDYRARVSHLYGTVTIVWGPGSLTLYYKRPDLVWSASQVLAYFDAQPLYERLSMVNKD